MDRVTISLQNKELINEIINSSENLKVMIPNSIMDAVNKRVVKTVMNSPIVDNAAKKAVESAENEIKKKYLVEEKGSFGYPYYKVNSKLQQVIDAAVRTAFSDEIDKLVKIYGERIAATYEKRLNMFMDTLLNKVQNYDAELDKAVGKAVKEAVEKRFGK